MKNFDYLIGMTLEEARNILEKESYKIRVINKDGKPLIVTRDHRTDRVNVFLVDGLIEKISRIG